MNKLTIIGNLTADPELRTIPSGVNVCTFTVAVNSKWRNEDGSSKRVDYFRVAAWRGLGENCARYLTKGKKVCVVGEITARPFESKDGILRASLELTADEVEFLSPRTDDGGYQRQYREPQGEASTMDMDDLSSQGFTEITDSDLPF